MGGWDRGFGESSALRRGQSLIMIRVGLSSLAVLLVVLMLGPVIVLWIYGEWQRQRREHQTARQVARCGMCGFHFRREEEGLLRQEEGLRREGEGLRREEAGQVATSCPRCSALVNLA